MRCIGRLTAILVFLTIGTGCGTSIHGLTFAPGYTLTKEVKIMVGTVENKTEKSFDIDINSMLSHALSEKLQAEGLLSDANSKDKLLINTTIIEYKEGNAFKRWLSPSYGSTVLDVSGALFDNGREVGKVKARRTVDQGGVFTIGAWKKVFSDVSEDIIADLKQKISN
jgi:Domain of unknown function (DUF4410)